MHYTEVCNIDTDTTFVEIHKHIKDEGWQSLRLSMKGQSTITKLEMCRDWLEEKFYTRPAQVQVMNYINALKRGGQLDKEGMIQR